MLLVHCSARSGIARQRWLYGAHASRTIPSCTHMSCAKLFCRSTSFKPMIIINGSDAVSLLQAPAHYGNKRFKKFCTATY